jgi:hypothetical protein
MARKGVVVLAILAVTVSARAQEAPEEATRRGLIEQADAAIQAGDHSRALALALQAGGIRMSPSLRQMVAEEQAALGRAVEALAGAVRCAAEAEADPALANREEILRNCRDLARRQRERVGSLVVDPVAPETRGLRVVVAGVEVPRSQWGTPWPVTPGRVEVVATAGSRTMRRELTVAPGQERRVTISLPAEAARADAETRPATRVAPSHVASLVIGGVGVGLAVAGAALGAATLSSYGDLSESCAGSVAGCANDDINAVQTKAVATNVLLALAGAAGVAAVIVFVVEGRAGTEESSATVRLGLGGATALVRF